MKMKDKLKNIDFAWGVIVGMLLSTAMRTILAILMLIAVYIFTL